LEGYERVAIIGVGHSRFGVHNDAILQEIAFEAVKRLSRMPVLRRGI
jgi:acetyl-CoA acetyltransferase